MVLLFLFMVDTHKQLIIYCIYCAGFIEKNYLDFQFCCNDTDSHKLRLVSMWMNIRKYQAAEVRGVIVSRANATICSKLRAAGPSDEPAAGLILHRLQALP